MRRNEPFMPGVQGLGRTRRAARGVCAEPVPEGRGLGDFLLEQSLNRDPTDLAARAIMTFCVGQGRYNGFKVGAVTCISFLDEEGRSPPKGTARVQAFKDLLMILNDNPTLETITSWIESHYHLAKVGQAPKPWIISWGQAANWKTILLAAHERSFNKRDARASAVVLMQSGGRFADPSAHAVVEDAANKLGIEMLRWDS